MMGFFGGNPRQEVPGERPLPHAVASVNTMRITCISHCLSMILAVSPFSSVRDLEEAYRRLFRLTLLRS